MIIRNEKGVVTVDYLFSLILVGGFCFIIFALSLTLSVVESIQYVTYSSARNYFSAAMNESEQRDNAYLKFQSLASSDALAPLLTSGWFELAGVPTIGDVGNNQGPLSDYKAHDVSQNLFNGTVVYFVSKVLEFNIPFYGSTVNDELRGGDEFGAYIGSYLGREVSQEECEDFLRVRWEKIKALSTGSAAPYSEAKGDNYYVGFADNGC